MATEPATLENLSVLHQSEDFIVVNKHWDIRIDSKMWYEKLTVQAQLRHRFPQLADPRTYYGFRSESHWSIMYELQKWSQVIVSVLSSSGSVISWISPRAGLSASPSIRQQLAGPTAALRTAPSPKPILLLCVYHHSHGDTYTCYCLLRHRQWLLAVSPVKLIFTTCFHVQAGQRWPFSFSPLSYH